MTDEQRRGMALHSLARFALREAVVSPTDLGRAIVRKAEALGLRDDIEQIKAHNLREHEALRARLKARHGTPESNKETDQ